MHHTLSGELDEDIDSLNFSYNKQKYDLRSNESKKGSQFPLNVSDQLEEIIDHSIEIEHNKRMRSANVNPWTLRFKDKNMEFQVFAKKIPSKYNFKPTFELSVQSIARRYV